MKWIFPIVFLAIGIWAYWSLKNPDGLADSPGKKQADKTKTDTLTSRPRNDHHQSLKCGIG